MFAKPQEEHRWLEQLVGRWHASQECAPPGGEIMQTESVMDCRMIGGLWLIGENTGTSEESGDWTCILTLGFDPQESAYVGTFVGSMMTCLWHYHGKVDETGKRLPLDTAGPTFDGTGVAQYRDTIEIISADQWNYSSELQNEDGTWTSLMKTEHRRT